MLRSHLRRHAANPHLVVRSSVRVVCPAEHLARRRQIAEHDAVESHHRNTMLWLNSCEHCLLSHWLSVTRFVGWHHRDAPLTRPPCRRLRGTRHRRDRVRADHVARERAGPAKLQCHPRGWSERRVPERRTRCVGAPLSGGHHVVPVPRSPFVPVHRHRLAHARRLGCRAPFPWQCHLALHADVVVRMRDLRQPDRHLVHRRRSIGRRRFGRSSKTPAK